MSLQQGVVVKKANMGVKVYYASVSGNQEVKKNQQRIFMILDGKKIDYEKVDITAGEEHKQSMRDLMGNPNALPPQIFNGNVYCGDYTAFDVAVEDGKIDEFLKL